MATLKRKGDVDNSLMVDQLKLESESLPALLFDVINGSSGNYPGITMLFRALGFLQKEFATKSLLMYLRYLEINLQGDKELIDKMSTRIGFIEQALSNEVMAAFIIRGVRKALNETRSEKLERLAAVTVNCTLRYNELAPETKMGAFELCEELSEHDIALLHVLERCERASMKEAAQNLLHAGEIKCDKISYLHMSFMKLNARGLIMISEERVETVQETLVTGGPTSGYKTLQDIFEEKHCEILPAGRDIMLLLKKPGEEIVDKAI